MPWIQSITEKLETAELMERLEVAEVPCGPIYSIDGAFNDPQAKQLQLSQTVTTVDGRPIPLQRQPFRLSRTPSTLARCTPEFAEHTDEILAEFGFSSAEEIKASRARGSVE